MWAESEEVAASTSPSSTTARPRTIAEIACQLCRRRKVKCDRTLPHCQVCIQTNQVCEYPLKPKKPGPKIGSLQRHKRRYRDREGTETTSTKSAASTARNTAGREKRSSHSPGSSVSDAEGTNGVTANGTDTSGTATARPRVRRSRGEAFESVFESVFEDDHEDEEEQTRPTRRESSKRQAPAQTEKTTERTERSEKRTGTTSPGNTANGTASTNDEWTQRRRNSRLNINDLSFILHPSHEASTPEKDGEHAGEGDESRPTENGPQNGPSPSVASPQALSLVQQACSALGVSESMLRASIQGYFANMVAINLFHQPSFADKLANIASPVQLFALLTAMMGYAVRFQTEPSSAASQPPAQSQPPVQPDIMDHIDPMLMAMPGTPMPAATPSTTMPPPPPPQPALPSPEHFLDMARRLIERALDECGDDPPTLVILQACIICTHCELTRGVHGRAWRSLGMCVRLAYEMNLHLVDAKTSTASTSSLSWRDAEEKRRAWWAIWEMDVFASTIRRTPTAVDWTQMETLLPVDDKDWFAAGASNVSGVNTGAESNGDKSAREASEARTKEAQEWRCRRSCFMELDPVRRWKALQASGNHSPKAWFLVINSLMKDARIISSPRGVPFREEAVTSNTTAKSASASASASPKRRASPPGPCPVEEARQKLEILANCVQCFVLALPAHLQYRNQFLGFGEGEPQSAYNLFSSSSTTPVTSLRQLHCGIYNIYVMTQLTRLMIHRYELFGSHAQHFRLSSSSSSSLTSSPATSARHPLNNPAVLPYFEAADNILTIVNRSCQEHIQHINPFLLSTLWLAAAVQLVRRHVAVPRGADRTNPSLASQQTLIKSRFDVLYLTYKRCAAFWNARTAMEQNLEALETQLEGDQGGQSEEEGEEEEDNDVAETTNKRDRSVSREDGQQRKKKKTKVTKEKEKSARVNGAAARTQASRASASANDHRQYTSWTRSNSQPQLSPASTAVQQTQSQVATQQTQTVTQAQQQMALALAHPNLQHPSMAVPSQQQTQAPPAPLSTYSDPTGASSAFIDGDTITGAGNGGGSGPNSASHISPTATAVFQEANAPPAAGQVSRPRRPPSALNYFKFDSPSGNHHSHSASASAHANGYEPASTPSATNGVDVAQAQALLTFMQMSRNNAAAQHNHTRDSFVVDNNDLDVPLSMISPAFFEPDLGMDDMQQQQQGGGGGGNNSGFEWRGLDLPMDIHDLLSGFSAY